MKHTYTAQEREDLHKMLTEMMNEGDNYCVMEIARIEDLNIKRKIMRIRVDIEDRWL